MKNKRHDELNKVWDDVWKNDRYSNPQLRITKAREKLDFFLKHVNIDASMQVLDVGCGGGYVANELYNRTGARIIGLDHSEEAINKARSNLIEKNISFCRGNALSLPFPDNYADVILNIGVIEHVIDHEKCIKESVRVLKNGGVLFVVSSNRNSFIFEHRKICEYFHLWNYGYQKNWDINALEDLFIQHGFSTKCICIGNGIGDLKLIDKLDRIFTSNPKDVRNRRGRYIYYIGTIKK